MKHLWALLLGLGFGIVLVKSEVISWFRIQAMFRFEEAHMYLIIGSAVVVGAVSLLIIKQFEMKTVGGEEISIREKPFNKGVIYGGIIFGMGWAVTGVYASIKGWNTLIPPLAIGGGIAAALLIGAIAGLYPALRAARLSPTEALRTT